MPTGASWSRRNGSRFSRCATQIDAYWQVLDATVGWSPQERNRLRLSFFYNELVPRRTAMLQIADRIASVNERGLTRSEDAVGRLGGQPAALPHVDLRGHAGRRPGPGAADHRLHAAAGAGTRPAPGGLAGTLDAAAARTGKRAPLAGARASRRNRAVALGDPDGDGGRRMRGPGGQCPRAPGFDQGAGGKDGQPGARPGAAAAAVDAGRSRPGAGVELARAGNQQAHGTERGGLAPTTRSTACPTSTARASTGWCRRR